MAFKMKRTPIKGIIDDFFKSIKAKETNMGDLRAKQARMSKGTSEYQYRVEESRRKAKARKNMVDKNEDGIPDFIQPRSITPAPEGQETVSSTDFSPEITSDWIMDKAKSSWRYKKNPDGTYTTKDTSRADMGEIIVGADHPSFEAVSGVFKKKSPYKKAKGSRGYKMKRK